MVDIALDLGRGLEGDRFCANDARDFAAHHDLLTCNHVGDFASFTDDNLGMLLDTLERKGRLHEHDRKRVKTGVGY